MKLCKMMVVCVFVGTAVASVSAGMRHHEGDVIIGRTPLLDSVLAAEVPEEPVLLEPTAPGALPGWSGAEPGFEALEEDEPNEDFWVLEAGVQVELEVLGLGNGLRMFDSAFNELTVGDTWLLGDEALHLHGLFLIDAAVNPDPLVTPGFLEFELHDLSATPGYGPSEAYTVQFIPEPSTAVLLVCGAVMLGGRRRGRRVG